MKDYNDEYFFLGLVESPNYPRLCLDDDFKGYANKFLRATPIEYDEDQLIQLKFKEPVPKKPKMVDYHSFITQSPVYSEKLKKVMEDMGVKDVQFVPVLIRNQNNDLIENHYAINICNRIECVDKEKSEYKLFNDGSISTFNKLVVDNEKLERIPLENRLIFAVEEYCVYVVYHISVIEKMLASEPEGMTVYRLSGWDPSVPFQEIYGEYLKSLGK